MEHKSFLFRNFKTICINTAPYKFLSEQQLETIFISYYRTKYQKNPKSKTLPTPPYVEQKLTSQNHVVLQVSIESVYISIPQFIAGDSEF
jgi:hypothetical protein